MKKILGGVIVLLSAVFGDVLVVTIPSDSLGGNVAAKIYFPDSARFSTGAPVIIYTPGGWGSGHFVAPPAGLLEQGFIWITYLLPGATDSGYTTDGIYDERGINCLFALKDVIKYAHGAIADIMGNRITDISPVDVDTGNIGLYGASNGGNMPPITLSLFGGELEAMVDYIIEWESPVSPEIAVHDLAVSDPFPGSDADGNGNPMDDYQNPYFVSFGDTQCTMDLSRIAVDTTYRYTSPDTARGAVFIDGNLNGTYDIAETLGIPVPDLNFNGVLDSTEDYLFNFLRNPIDGKRYYTTQVTEALFSLVDPALIPSDIANPAQTRTFWNIRSAVFHYDNLPAHFPDLRMMILVSEIDHAEQAYAKPHIHQTYDGFARNDLWVRLNPDSIYLAEISSIPISYTDNDANTCPSDWADITDWSYPDAIPLDVAFVTAACEMSDRVHYDVFEDPNLDIILSPRPLTQPPIYGYLLSHNEEPPLNPRYFEDSVVFFYNRMELLYLANRLFDAGVKLCWQSEWNFAKAVPLYDHGDGTAGMNIVQYMHDSLGFEIDPHAHESVYNYADVAYFIQQCGVTPSGVVGGFVAYPETACIVEHFFAPIEADSFPGYVWTPQILSAPGTRDHIDEDSLWISGVWKPPDAEHFLEHSDTAPLPCVGKYLSNWEGFWDIISRAESGELDPNKLYTAGIFIAQGGLSHAGTDSLISELDDLQEYTNTDRIRWTTIEEIVQIWRTVYDSVPNMLWYGVPASDVEQNPGPGQPNQIEIAVRPNPFNSACVITAPAGTDISIYDLSGRSVFRRPTRIALGNGWESFLWVPAPSLPSGIYVIRGIRRDNTALSRRVLLIR